MENNLREPTMMAANKTMSTRYTANPLFAAKNKQFLMDLKKSHLPQEASSEQSSNNRSLLKATKKLEPKPPLISIKFLKKDPYCWSCHLSDAGVACTWCKRSFHQKCVPTTPLPQPTYFVCNHCQSHKETWAGPEKFSTYAIYIIQNLLKEKDVLEDETLINIVRNASSDYLDAIIEPMDIVKITKKNESGCYPNGKAFLADIKWIYHNSFIYFGGSHATTMSAKRMLNIVKSSLSDLDHCPQCYVRANAGVEDWFVRVCDTPHPVVMAKVRGYPPWPSKVLFSDTNNAECWFFGPHDKAVVPFSNLKLVSKEIFFSTLGKKQQKLQKAIDELKSYVTNFEEKFGPFAFYPPDTSPTPGQLQARPPSPSSSSSLSSSTEEQITEPSEESNQNSEPNEKDPSPSPTPLDVKGIEMSDDSSTEENENQSQIINVMSPKTYQNHEPTNSNLPFLSISTTIKRKASMDSPEPMAKKLCPMTMCERNEKEISYPRVTLERISSSSQVKHSKPTPISNGVNHKTLPLPPLRTSIKIVNSFSLNTSQLDKSRLDSTTNVQFAANPTAPMYILVPVSPLQILSPAPIIEEQPSEDHCISESELRKLLTDSSSSSNPDDSPSQQSFIDEGIETIDQSFKDDIIETIDLTQDNEERTTLIENDLKDKVKRLRKELRDNNFKLEQQKGEYLLRIRDIRTNHHRFLSETTTFSTEESKRAITLNKEELNEYYANKIKEYKLKDWCVRCGLEASYFCCRNTSYCSYTCQSQHWGAHSWTCSRASQKPQPPAPVSAIPLKPVRMVATIPPHNSITRPSINRPQIQFTSARVLVEPAYQ